MQFGIPQAYACVPAKDLHQFDGVLQASNLGLGFLLLLGEFCLACSKKAHRFPQYLDIVGILADLT